MEYPTKTSSGFLILICSISNIFCICPLKCSCSSKNRNVDCSVGNLTALPYGLQDNITNLNLSYNQFVNLDSQLTKFTNLRSLDISHNFLRNLPSHLPKSLWEVYASNNNIKDLHKLDTAYQWNLKVLDMSRNRLQRTILINNTLGSLQLLNLSSNRLWTVPTNMPHNVKTIDLSNNLLTQILQGTLVRMSSLRKLYLHSNRFTYIPKNAFDQLTNLQEITLYDNPWECKIQSIVYLLMWVREKTNNVIGHPCVNESSLQGITNYPYLTETTDQVLNTPILKTSISPFLEAQETKLYKQIPFLEPITAATLKVSDIFFPSRDFSIITEEGSADVHTHLSPDTLGTKDASYLSSNEIDEMESYDYTLTFSNNKGKSGNELDLQLPSTTICAEMPTPNIKLKDHASSSAHKDTCLASSVFLMLLVFRTV
ncbi:oligodendrocyte-myelin glycoprotein [Bombina bombina]|uniref:oligodendrocyte-myelin glycoprotein n=1 Tax=Bombina bombina TaxID=8345 RepID=UPI00235B2FBB|nr:oligodendrocyte-myelin glycoprotein [Bombina bombina]